MKNTIIKVKTSLLFFALISVNPAYSADIVSGFDNRKIDKLTISEDTVILDVKGLLAGPEDACALIDGTGIKLESDNPKFDEIYSMLLSAKLSETSISMRYKNNNKSVCVVLEVSISK